jgi:hypothetical protein
MNDAIVCDTPDKIFAFQLLSMRSALKLEILGLKFSRGSVAQQVRYLTGSRTRDKKKLLGEFETLLKFHGFLK